MNSPQNQQQAFQSRQTGKHSLPTIKEKGKGFITK